jgi:hypothetical protein
LIYEGYRWIVGANLIENKYAPDGFDLGSDAPWKSAATKEKEATDQGASASIAVVHLRQELA